MKHSDLKTLRTSKSLTIKQLSDITGIHPPHISQIEKGHRPLTPDTKKKIIEALEVDMKMLEL